MRTMAVQGRVGYPRNTFGQGLGFPRLEIPSDTLSTPFDTLEVRWVQGNANRVRAVRSLPNTYDG
jgi:hypothetical protein